MPNKSPPDNPIEDLRGASRLTIDAVVGVTDLVEAMHRNISSGSSLAGITPEGPTQGITGFVYRSVRGITRTVGKGLDIALGALTPLLSNPPELAGRAPVVAALNGVLGDHLAAKNNPLAIAMRLALRDADAAPTGKVLVLVHGLCMSGAQWTHDGRDHGVELAQALGYSAVYADYNSGLHISLNGRELAQQLESLLKHWPVPVQEFVILGHSMGGLVARSAVHYAGLAGLDWPKQLSKMIFLGTPHHGAPLEKAGAWLDMLLGATPYTAPLARIGLVRSAGIQDLRHGNVVDEHWGRSRPSNKQQVHLPPEVACYAVAGVRGERTAHVRNKVVGDGLVPLDSALGQHPRASHALCFPPEQTCVLDHTDHFDLLGSDRVTQQLLRWLE